MSAAQRERTENALNNLFACWKDNGLSTPMKFLNMEKQREACIEAIKVDQGQCLKLYSIGVEYLMKMIEAGRTGNAGEIYKIGNESWTETVVVTEKYWRDRAAAAQKLWQSFVPAQGSSATEE